VQGSKQAPIFITSELRTDNVGCAGLCPIPHIRVLTNPSEQEWYRRGHLRLCLLLKETKAFLFAIWPDLSAQLFAAKIPQYTKYSGISAAQFGRKSLDQLIKKQFSEADVALF